VVSAVRQLVGLQAQIPNPPYIGMWTRLSQFERDDLTQLMETRQIIRAAMMRSTLHLMTREDHQQFRKTLQPALERALRAFFGKRGQGHDIDALCAAADLFMAEEARSTGELRECLLKIAPDADGDALAYVVRTHLPMVQVPPGGTWGAGSRASYVTAAAYFGEAPSATRDLRTLLHRYLAAFGPASIMDFQAWSGFVRLDKELAPLKDELVLYYTEDSRELLDLPDAPLPDANTPAPVRFIPEYDNLLISHADRTRIIAAEDYPKVFLSAGRVLGTILVDGFVNGTWKIKKQKKMAVLEITPFTSLTSDDENALMTEGLQLLQFVEDSASAYEVLFMRDSP
jgi:hypothetical protein